MDGLVHRGVLLFHDSAICMGGQAVIFTAPGGTGKSTRARLWRETTKEQIVDTMYAEYDVPREVIDEDTARVLDILRNIGALYEWRVGSDRTIRTVKIQSFDLLYWEKNEKTMKHLIWKLLHLRTM